LKIQIISLLNKTLYEQWYISDKEYTKPDWELIKDFITKLPFELTNAQKKVIKQIIDDFYTGKPMLRLLQWDVWSWKTIVATICAYYIIKKIWWQIAFLAPTEVLANQHVISISKLLLPLWIRMELITWSTTKIIKDKIKADLISW
jgi:ATP-dependent DNA helicase RecG